MNHDSRRRVRAHYPVAIPALVAGCFIACVAAPPPEQAKPGRRAVALSVSEEHSVGEPTETTAVWDQYAPSAAFGAGIALMTWTDWRIGGTDGLFGSHVFVSRATLDGTILDPAGVALARGNRPAVAFDGTNFLVVWDADGNRVMGARVSPDGTIVDADGFDVASGREPDVAYAAGRYWVVSTNDDDIYAAVVAPNGTVEETGLWVSDGGLDDGGVPDQMNSAPIIASNGADALVLWSRRNQYSYELWAALIVEGNVGQPFGIPGAWPPAACVWDGKQFVAAWGGPALSTISTTGQVASHDPADPAGSEGAPELVRAGDATALLWQDTTGVLAAPIDANMNLGEPRLVSATSHLEHGFLTGGADGILAGFSQWVELPPPLSGFASSFDRALIRPLGLDCAPTGEEIPITRVTNDQRAPALAVGPNGGLLTWDERSSDGERRRAVLTDGTGTPGTEIASDGAVVTRGPDQFLTVWLKDAALLAQRLDSQGTPLDPSPMRIDGTGAAVCGENSCLFFRDPAAAWNGTEYLIAYVRRLVTDTNYYAGDLCTTTMGPAGSSSAPTCVAMTYSPSALDVAASPGAFLVVGEHSSQVFGSFVQGGAGSDPFVIFDGALRPRVAYDGDRFVATALRNKTGSESLLAAEIHPGTQPAIEGPVQLSPPGHRVWGADVVFDGARLLASWSATDGTTTDLYATVIARGAPLPAVPPEPYVISSSAPAELPPSLASAGNGVFIVAYPAFDADGGSVRLRLRSIDVGAPEPRADAGAEASGDGGGEPEDGNVGDGDELMGDAADGALSARAGGDLQVGGGCALGGQSPASPLGWLAILVACLIAGVRRGGRLVRLRIFDSLTTYNFY